MKYGENHELVELIITQIAGMNLFSKNNNALLNVIKINDFERALSLALEYDRFNRLTMKGESLYNLKELKESQMDTAYKKLYNELNYKEFNKIIK